MRNILILILSLLMAAPSHAAKNTDNAKAVLDRTAKNCLLPPPTWPAGMTDKHSGA